MYNPFLSRTDGEGNSGWEVCLVEKLTLRSQFRLFRGGKAFGPGMAELLEGIVRTGSLRQSAMAMDMSYNKAWSVLRQSEANLGIQLVERVVGGAGGGGSRLTPEGLAFLERYRSFCAEANACLERLADQYFGGGDEK
jgi:molybdate transport system regulatory protein